MNNMPKPDLPVNQRLASGEEVIIRLLLPSDTDRLISYFADLSEATKKRFGPHSFEPQVVRQLCETVDHSHTLRLVAATKDNSRIIAYVLLLYGFLDADQARYKQQHITLNSATDVTLAPSVADGYQSKGLGSKLMEKTIDISRSVHKKRIILWGGVQATNDKAVKFYCKSGFQQVGQFSDHNGVNYDMVLVL